MKYREFVKVIAERTGHSQQAVVEIIRAMFDIDGEIVACMIHEDKLSIPNFGTFFGKRTQGKAYRHPSTGEMTCPSSRIKPCFRPSSRMQEVLWRIKI